MSRSMLSLLLAATFATACSGGGAPPPGGAPGGPDATPGDAARADEGVAAPDAADSGHTNHGGDGGSGDASGGDASASALHGCSDDRFVDRTAGTDDDRMLHVSGMTFMTPCMTIRAGQNAVFMWRFADHPLAGGVAPGQSGTGTTPSPIEARSTGAIYSVTFPNPGNYPYYCTRHAGDGMVGVVRVVP